MPNVKKAFVEVVEFLEANQDKKVKTIMPELLEMVQSRGAGGTQTTVVKDPDTGEIVGKRCGYYKQFMPLAYVEFGQKQSAADGLNPYCKEGVSNFSRQRREHKDANEKLLARVVSGEVAPDQIEAEQAKLDEARSAIIPREDGFGYDTAEELLAALKDGSAEAQYQEYLASQQTEEAAE